MINCVSICHGAISPARFIRTGTQLMYGGIGENHYILGIKKAIFSRFLSHITNSTNCFMQCRQNTVGTGKPTIQHCILFTKRLARFLKDLRTSNMYRGNTDAVKIRYVDDFQKDCKKFTISNEMNMSCSNTPASMNTVTSIKKNNFNDITTTMKIQEENTLFYKIISGITKVLFLQCPQYFLN